MSRQKPLSFWGIARETVWEQIPEEDRQQAIDQFARLVATAVQRALPPERSVLRPPDFKRQRGESDEHS
jgi:hypothetical protein